MVFTNKTNNKTKNLQYFEPLEIDVAIAGGGLAGLNSALEASEAGFKVALFEAAGWLGGRMLSESIPRTPIAANMGSMRVSSNHPCFMKVAKKLKLHLDPFDFYRKTAFDLRNLRFPPKARESGTASLACAALPFPYAMTAQEAQIAKSPDDLVAYAIALTLQAMRFPKLPIEQAASLYSHIQKLEPQSPDWSLISSKDWSLIQRYGHLDGNRPFYKYGFWGLLQRHLSDEAYQFVDDAFGYESISGNWNAAAAMPWFVADFDPKQEWFTVRGGFQQVTRQFEKKLHQRGCTIATNHRLLRVAPIDNSSRWRLEFATGDDGQHRRVVIARHIVLALPRRPLEALDVDYPGWAKFTTEYLSAVEPHPLLKVFLVFETTWWSKSALLGGETTGRIFTTRPLRQVYHWGPQEMTQSGVRKTATTDTDAKDWAMIMVYCDDRFESFWQPLEEGVPYFHEPADWNEMSKEGQAHLLHIRDRYGAPPPMVQELRRQLAELHGLPLSEVPEPVVAFYVDWGQEPHQQAGWHTWRAGVKTWEVAERITKPFPDAELYICGEAYSVVQGWLEGSLQSAHEVIKKLKKLKRSKRIEEIGSVDVASDPFSYAAIPSRRLKGS